MDKNGRMNLNSNATHKPGSKDYEIYKNFSILNSNICPADKEMQNESNIFRTLPIYKSKNRQIPNKLSIVWNSKLQKYFNISYNS